MRRMIWEWIVDADDWIADVALDVVLAVLGALVVTESLRSVVSIF